MKTKAAIICLLCFCLCSNLKQVSVFADEAANPEWMPEISADTAFETKYIWRGQTLVDDVVMQPGASIKFDSITVSFWGNYDLGSLDKFTEWDYTFDYTLDVGDIMAQFRSDRKYSFLEPISLSFGYIFYTFPPLSGEAYDSQEFYTRFSYDIFTQPFVAYYDDFDTGRGSYWEFGGGHTFKLYQNTEATIGIVSGYNAGQWGYDWSFSNLLFSGEIAVSVMKYFVVAPNVNYSLALDRQYNSEFYGGIKATIKY